MERSDSSLTRPVVAVVQHPPVWFDRAATLARAVGFCREAAGMGATLVAFPEAFVSGYPFWLFRLTPDDWDVPAELYSRFVDSAVDLTGDDLSPILEAARELGVTIALPVNEVERGASGGTVFNTLVVVGPDGTLLNRHRKLIATNAERMAWAPGDASGLRTFETPLGRVGGLICFENLMPLARYALIASGETIHLAPTAYGYDAWTAWMRHVAAEHRAWVVSPSVAFRWSDVPADFPHAELMGYKGSDDWGSYEGGSVIVDPWGEIVAGPLWKEHNILYATIDPATATRSRFITDSAGHYDRPDLFELTVDRRTRRSTTYLDDPSDP
jgi:nitrilase